VKRQIILIALVCLSALSALAASLQDNQNPICVAVFDGNFDKVTALVKSGVKVNDPTAYLQPLDAAVMERNLAIVKFLIESGADPNYVGKPGHTLALSAACFYYREKSDLAIVEYLVGHGAKINPPTRDVYLTPLEAAVCSYGEGSDAVIDFLIAHGAKVNPRPNNPSVMHGALSAKCPLPPGKLPLIRKLLALGTRYTGDTEEDFRMLWLAIFSPEVRDLFKAKGANFRILNKRKDTLLHYAATSENLGVVRFLLQTGLDPLQKNASGLTPRMASKRAWDASEVVMDLGKWKPVWDELERAERKARTQPSKT
jgi:ankyrin repeat protein